MGMEREAQAALAETEGSYRGLVGMVVVVERSTRLGKLSPRKHTARDIEMFQYYCKSQIESSRPRMRQCINNKQLITAINEPEITKTHFKISVTRIALPTMSK